MGKVELGVRLTLIFELLRPTLLKVESKYVMLAAVRAVASNPVILWGPYENPVEL